MNKYKVMLSHIYNEILTTLRYLFFPEDFDIKAKQCYASTIPVIENS